MMVHVDDLAATRRALHAVAELVLAGPQYRRTGTIRLRVTDAGFATIREPTVAVEGAELVTDKLRIGISERTCAELAAMLGVAAGKPEDLYRDGSGVAADEVLEADSELAAYLTECFHRGDQALRDFAPEVPDEQRVLWPEHFDVGISVDEINYGVSPGDGYSAEPYAYVGPWQPRQGPFWNAPFGAVRLMRELPDAGTVATFFAEGRARAREDAPKPSPEGDAAS
jgi:hypothetical protein